MSQRPDSGCLPADSDVDVIRDMLSVLANALEAGDASSTSLQEIAASYAAARVQSRARLRDVVEEFRVLRRVVSEQYTMDAVATNAPLTGLAVLHDLLDCGIASALDEFVSERQRVRETFLGILSHDLRQPLNSIRVSADVLRADMNLGPEQVRRMAELIATSTVRMAAMLDDLLDCARLPTTSALPVQPRTVSVCELVRRTAAEVGAAYPGRRLECSTRAEVARLEAEWDPDRVTEAVSNLLNNALTHGRDPVCLDVKRDGEFVFIDVSSKGEIARDMMAQLFEPFASNADRQSGHVGLGLYIVRQIAAGHRGTVDARSANGTTTFRLALPRRATRGASDAARARCV